MAKYLKVNMTLPATQGREIPLDYRDKFYGFIHGALGKNNKYHGKYSDYCISELQGWKMSKDKKRTIYFEENSNPYFVFSSPNMNFLIDMFTALMSYNGTLFGMKVKSIEKAEYSVHDYYDKVVTISPIFFKDLKTGMDINVDDNEDFLEQLTERMAAKCRNNGYSTEGLKFEYYNRENAHKRGVMIHGRFVNGSKVGLKVYGKKETREFLYETGLGCDTGSCFGAVKVYK